GLHSRQRRAAVLGVHDLLRGLGRPGDGREPLPGRDRGVPQGCLNAIEYLTTCGSTGEQAYLVQGSAPIEGRLSGVVDIPNACCSLYVRTAIFDFDVGET